MALAETQCFDPTFLLRRNHPSILLIFGHMPNYFTLRKNYQTAQVKAGIKQWLQTRSLLTSREGRLLVTNITCRSLCVSDIDLHKCHVLVLYICLSFYLQLPFLYSGHLFYLSFTLQLKRWAFLWALKYGLGPSCCPQHPVVPLYQHCCAPIHLIADLLLMHNSKVTETKQWISLFPYWMLSASLCLHTVVISKYLWLEWINQPIPLNHII